MKKDVFYQAVGGVKPHLLENFEKMEGQTMKKKMNWIVVAACFVLLLGAAVPTILKPRQIVTTDVFTHQLKVDFHEKSVELYPILEFLTLDEITLRHTDHTEETWNYFVSLKFSGAFPTQSEYQDVQELFWESPIHLTYSDGSSAEIDIDVCQMEGSFQQFSYYTGGSVENKDIYSITFLGTEFLLSESTSTTNYKQDWIEFTDDLQEFVYERPKSLTPEEESDYSTNVWETYMEMVEDGSILWFETKEEETTYWAENT